MALNKRSASPALIANPLIKKRNLAWTLLVPADSDAQSDDHSKPVFTPSPEPASAAAIESGQVSVDDHLERFTSLLSAAALPQITNSPRLSIADYAALYASNAGSPLGAHFVIHQHDHPIAGTHYDLRLQINPTSSASWAIMYGIPGDPNSVRLNRNATETRVHSLWNHLIETASRETGSLLIWDTGTYTVLPRRSKHAPALDPSSQDEDQEEPISIKTQQELLHAAFQNRKIKLQLHGTKLPDPYVVYLRLTKTEDAAGRAKAKRPTKRRRRRTRAEPETTDSNPSSEDEETVKSHATEGVDAAAVTAEEKELRELEDEHVRRTNAYTGAVNSIGSVHQRRWYLSLDRSASGLKLERGRWNSPDGYPFHVLGRDAERSVVTGRLGEDVFRDEGVVGFTPRQGWKPVIK